MHEQDALRAAALDVVSAWLWSHSHFVVANPSAPIDQLVAAMNRDPGGTWRFPDDYGRVDPDGLLSPAYDGLHGAIGGHIVVTHIPEIPPGYQLTDIVVPEGTVGIWHVPGRDPAWLATFPLSSLIREHRTGLAQLTFAGL